MKTNKAMVVVLAIIVLGAFTSPAHAFVPVLFGVAVAVVAAVTGTAAVVDHKKKQEEKRTEKEQTSHQEKVAQLAGDTPG